MDFLESVITILIGVSTFIIGQIIIEVYIKPWQKYKELLSKILWSLTYYANKYNNPILIKDIDEKNRICTEYLKASSEIRNLASELSVFTNLNSTYGVFLPSKSKINESVGLLIGISNSFFYTECTKEIGENRLSTEKIKRNLSKSAIIDFLFIDIKISI